MIGLIIMVLITVGWGDGRKPNKKYSPLPTLNFSNAFIAR